MGMTGMATDPQAWLSFVTRQLKEHDNSWPTSLDSDEGLSEGDKASRDRLRAKWQEKRDLYAHDVKAAAEAVGLAVDVRGYPMLPEPVKQEPRNGFLSPEDAARLRGMISPGEPPFDLPHRPYVGDAMEAATLLLAPILDKLHERLERERESSRAMGDDGEPRFKQIISSRVVMLDDGDVKTELLALDVEGRVWAGEHFSGASYVAWWRTPAKVS